MSSLHPDSGDGDSISGESVLRSIRDAYTEQDFEKLAGFVTPPNMDALYSYLDGIMPFQSTELFTTFGILAIKHTIPSFVLRSKQRIVFIHEMNFDPQAKSIRGKLVSVIFALNPEPFVDPITFHLTENDTFEVGEEGYDPTTHVGTGFLAITFRRFADRLN
jgi:hypothetical protein